MAKTIKFNLICDGQAIRTLEDLRENFSIEDVIGYYDNQLLERWLSVRGYEAELEKVQALTGLELRDLVKELALIFEVETDPAVIEENTYILQYKKEKEDLLMQIEEKEQATTNVIDDYHANYIELVDSIIDNKDNMPKIKAIMKELVKSHEKLFQLNYRELFYTLLEEAPLAVFVMLQQEEMRPYFINEKEEQSLDEDDQTNFIGFYLNLHRQAYSEEPVNIQSKDKEKITVEIRNLVENIVSDYDEYYEQKEDGFYFLPDVEGLPNYFVGDYLKIYSGETDGYWKDLGPKDKKYMVIYIREGDYVRNLGVIEEELDKSAVEGQFIITNGLNYRSKYLSNVIIYMEV